jgi:putative glutamine amidotransferase
MVPGTRLATCWPGRGAHKINSVHHQGIKDLAPGFTVEATSPDDGMIEAIRATGGPWVHAVQWHPEFHARSWAWWTTAPC